MLSNNFVNQNQCSACWKKLSTDQDETEQPTKMFMDQLINLSQKQTCIRLS